MCVSECMCVCVCECVRVCVYVSACARACARVCMHARADERVLLNFTLYVYAGVCLGRKPGRARSRENVSVRQRKENTYLFYFFVYFKCSFLSPCIKEDPLFLCIVL